MTCRSTLLPAAALACVLAGAASCAGPERRPGTLPSGARGAERTYRTTEQKLYSQFQLWKGAPYRDGGTSTGGVDCSGLVMRTFGDLFDVSLPRTVREQARTGRPVRQRELLAGDLVFFKTGILRRHVGIYLDGRTFMHASTRRGVTISSLDSRYWSRRFWTARRLLD